MTGSEASAIVVTHVAMCSMFTTGYGASPCRRWQQSGQAGDAHEGAEQLLAVLGPVVGVGDAAAGDRLGEGPAGAQRSR